MSGILFAGMAAVKADIKRREEARFLTSLDWTPAQIAVYQARVQGIADRLAAR